MYPSMFIPPFQFQSTPPGWEATLRTLLLPRFNPVFQSTPPGWEATCYFFCYRYSRDISIHASRVGGDCKNL